MLDKRKAQHRLLTAVRVAEARRAEVPVLDKRKAQHRLFTAVRLAEVRRPEVPVLDKRKAQHRLLTAVRHCLKSRCRANGRPGTAC